MDWAALGSKKGGRIGRHLGRVLQSGQRDNSSSGRSPLPASRPLLPGHPEPGLGKLRLVLPEILIQYNFGHNFLARGRTPYRKLIPFRESGGLPFQPRQHLLQRRIGLLFPGLLGEVFHVDPVKEMGYALFRMGTVRSSSIAWFLAKARKSASSSICSSLTVWLRS